MPNPGTAPGSSASKHTVASSPDETSSVIGANALNSACSAGVPPHTRTGLSHVDCQTGEFWRCLTRPHLNVGPLFWLIAIVSPRLATSKRVAFQKLLYSAADVAAVAFSANPITGNLDEIMINASWGLGESIVGGTVTPDTYIVRKPDMAILQRVIADKQHMTVSAPGGTHEVDVPRFLRNQASLDDEQVVELAKLALTLEDTMGHPVDIEGAFAAGVLYLLQCRPITTLR